ncbi:HET-domain-containing protein, partial [Lizonia empirigonia]
THSTPKRILKLSDGHVWLCEGIDSVPHYACLSHCWGPKGPTLKLNSDTMTALTAGICVDRLPKTFQDAVVLCLNLGIQYLWIDALCILQDNEDDWKRAAASMADIYAGATITIAATWSDDSDGGSRYTERDKSWPLLDRAWVYQERKLSARVVHLAKEQLYWECDSTFLSEDGLEDLESNNGDLRALIVGPNIAWRNVVQHYSRLKLTFEKDRLPAISAVVKRMQPLREGDVYIAGMWLNSLLSDLTWHVASLEAPPRSREVRHPSWSWVS